MSLCSPLYATHDEGRNSVTKLLQLLEMRPVRVRVTVIDYVITEIDRFLLDLYDDDVDDDVVTETDVARQQHTYGLQAMTTFGFLNIP